MNTSDSRQTDQAFAVWLTGLPSSGKSTIAAALVQKLARRGVRAAVLESDLLRKVLTPEPTYTASERETFYRAVAYIGALLVSHGVPVIFDATAHRRAYRDQARAAIAHFIEVYVDCPLEVAVVRDPKGIYHRGRDESVGEVPGLHVEYEPPMQPAVVVRGDRDAPDASADMIVNELNRLGYLTPQEL